MKYPLRLTLCTGLLVFCACTMFQAKQPAPPQVVPMKALVAPVGKNWQVEIEAPAMTNVRTNQLPFQTEQSVQPTVTQPVSPAEQRKIETPR